MIYFLRGEVFGVDLDGTDFVFEVEPDTDDFEVANLPDADFITVCPADLAFMADT